PLGRLTACSTRWSGDGSTPVLRRVPTATSPPLTRSVTSWRLSAWSSRTPRPAPAGRWPTRQDRGRSHGGRELPAQGRGPQDGEEGTSGRQRRAAPTRAGGQGADSQGD